MNCKHRESRVSYYQLEILPRGGTDGGAMQLVRSGVPVITLPITAR